jgi:hypothetical protein
LRFVLDLKENTRLETGLETRLAIELETIWQLHQYLAPCCRTWLTPSGWLGRAMTNGAGGPVGRWEGGGELAVHLGSGLSIPATSAAVPREGPIWPDSRCDIEAWNAKQHACTLRRSRKLLLPSCWGAKEVVDLRGAEQALLLPRGGKHEFLGVDVAVGLLGPVRAGVLLRCRCLLVALLHVFGKSWRCSACWGDLAIAADAHGFRLSRVKALDLRKSPPSGVGVLQALSLTRLWIGVRTRSPDRFLRPQP